MAALCRSLLLLARLPAALPPRRAASLAIPSAVGPFALRPAGRLARSFSGGIQQPRTTAVSAPKAAKSPAAAPFDDRIPVTLLTGYLGSGKTTVLNYILKADHGLRIAVIENEFGEEGIDGSLVAEQMAGAEDIVLLNNGCLCCTVRGDLVRMLGDLVSTKRDRFDHIVIEASGLADPRPIVQTFFLEEEIANSLRLDGVVTLVDAKFAMRHLDEIKPAGAVNEALEQVAFADRILISKADLVSPSELAALESRVTSINALARVSRSTHGAVELPFVLGIGGFDLDRVVDDVEPALLAVPPPTQAAHGHAHSHGPAHGEPGHEAAGCDHPDHAHSHGAEEDGAGHGHVHGPGCGHEGHDHGVAGHVHDDAIKSVSLILAGNLDLDKVNDWLGYLLDTRQEDIYRMKGVLAIDGTPQRFVFQGVHEMFEGKPDRKWKEGEDRTSRLVFIGKELDKAALMASFTKCLVPPYAPAAGKGFATKATGAKKR